MGKRSRDLFTLLEEREQDTRQAPETRRKAPEPSGLLAAVKQWLAPPRAAGRRGPAPGVPGVLLAAVALLCLGAGFGLGRWLPRAEAGNEGLNVRSDPGPQRPGPIAPAPALAGAIAPEKEAEILSNRSFVLLSFPAPQAEEAARAAAYLRAQGVETTRIRKMQKPDKSDVWAVLSYVLGDGEATLAAVKKVAPSRDWPLLNKRIQALSISDLQTY